MFKEYVEDFNTATFPHKKYYNLDQWEIRRAQKKASRGAAEEFSFFDDESRRKAEIQKVRDHRQVQSVMKAYEDMKADTDLAEAMKRQRMLKEQMDTLFRQGRSTEAEKIQRLLKPDEPT
eukprot:GHVO01044586.1.p1 GENE.GHVO01044586.1~~GHVO01044586.1.p1  ORF type:complete len:120 (+),score=28.80 GHVO01044586.1:63-422(+)